MESVTMWQSLNISCLVKFSSVGTVRIEAHASGNTAFISVRKLCVYPYLEPFRHLEIHIKPGTDTGIFVSDSHPFIIGVADRPVVVEAVCSSADTQIMGLSEAASHDHIIPIHSLP